ncbi:hypothetical protein YK48G_02840 [Lentilactobacillus fungorum]|jgi:hypothetical protein|uniref:Uncharacterized protein n=1 Tax=Lentilactobacillus fungorum TaxID=2201250 RepID=A0ABQ3VY83_9LACO|nr:hypothetical protein [Lentilactobacillus fungorum]GHP12859.1 hypothetical protein YK48G_02840 [Lentilactobacillus fungorum]
MQNNQSYLSEITKSVKDNYNRFFELVTTTNRVKQMPTFQLKLFINQALTQNFPVVIQFNDQTPDIAGHLKQINEQRFVVTSASNRLSRLFSLGEVQAIKKF